MAAPSTRKYTVIIGAKFGPVVIPVEPLVAGETVDLSGGAYIRLSKDGVSRDSTVASGEIVVDDSAKTVTWTMFEADTAELTAGTWDGELACIDAAGEDHVPFKPVVIAQARLEAPA